MDDSRIQDKPWILFVSEDSQFLTYLSDQIQSIQNRAIRIIYNPTIGMPYIFALTYADLELLKRRRETQARVLFKKILSQYY